MRYRFLGTGAAEGWPAMFCQCPTCRKVQQLGGGPNYRTRAGGLIDEDLLIDLSPDIFYQRQLYNLDLGKVNNCLITHPHSDHFHVQSLEMRLTPFAHYEHPVPKLGVWGDQTVIDYMESMKQREIYNLYDAVEPHLVKPFDQLELDADTRVLVLPAKHDDRFGCYFYLVMRGGKAMIYGHDTGDFAPEALAAIRETGVVLDLVTLDCTNGPQDFPGGHMGIPQNIQVRDKLLDQGSADSHTRFVITHFSHNSGGVLHEDLVKIAMPLGFEVAYDGMLVEV